MGHHNTLTSGFQTTLEEEAQWLILGARGHRRQRTQCLLDITELLYSWTHGSCGYLHQTKSVNILAWNGKGLMPATHQLRSYGELMASGGRRRRVRFLALGRLTPTQRMLSPPETRGQTGTHGLNGLLKHRRHEVGGSRKIVEYLGRVKGWSWV